MFGFLTGIEFQQPMTDGFNAISSSLEDNTARSLQKGSLSLAEQAFQAAA